MMAMSSRMLPMYCSKSDKAVVSNRSAAGLPFQPFVNHRISVARNFVPGVEEPQLDRASAAAKSLGVLPHPLRRVVLITFRRDVEHVNHARLIFAFGLPIARNAAADRHHTPHRGAVRESEPEVRAGCLRKSEQENLALVGLARLIESFNNPTNQVMVHRHGFFRLEIRQPAETVT